MTGYVEAVIKTLQELQRLHELNVELLEQLDVACTWLLENHVKVPNESTFYSLLSKSKATLAEIYNKDLITASRRKVTPSETDDKETEPLLPPLFHRLFSVFAV